MKIRYLIVVLLLMLVVGVDGLLRILEVMMGPVIVLVGLTMILSHRDSRRR